MNKRLKGLGRYILILTMLLMCLNTMGCFKNSDYKIEEIEDIDKNGGPKVEEVIETVVERSSKVDEIARVIEEIVGEYKDNMSVYYYNFDYDEEYYFNEDRYYLTASLRKIPQLMEVADKIQQGQFTLDTEVEYISEDYYNGTGILQFEEQIGSRKINELIELSIKESDNIAFNMLTRICGDDLIPYIRELVGDYEIPDGEYKKLTARHYFQILNILYTNPDNNPYYSMIIEYMKDTAFNDSINKYLPKGMVAHKIGSYFRYYHDMGFVFGKENYMLIILTKDIGVLSDDPQYTEEQEERNVVDWGKEAWEIIAQISKRVYEIIEKTGV